MKTITVQLTGEIDNLICALAAFVILDYITAAMNAIINKRWAKKNFGLKSIFEKAGIVICVCIAHIIDTMIIGNQSALRTLTILFYLSKEGIAVLDNLERLGVPLPPKIIKTIRQLSKEEDSG